MTHVLMLCHDQHLDRRVIAQGHSLTQLGHQVTLLCLSLTSEDEVEMLKEGIHLFRVGLKNIVPDNRIYKQYMARQRRLNDGLNRLCNRFHTVQSIWKAGFHLISRANGMIYRSLLLVRYLNRSLGDPLPFRHAFLTVAQRFSPDLIEVHDLPALSAGVSLAKQWGVPLVYDAHELYPEQRSFSFIQRRICARAEKELIQSCDKVFVVNDSIAKEMAKRYSIPRPVTLLNALDPPSEYQPNVSYDLLREKLSLDASRQLLLFQGGFSPHRNLENLISAMSLVKNPAVDLVMMGFGDFVRILKKRASRLNLLDKRIYFLPAVPADELLQHSASADAGIIPYPHVDLNSYYCTPNKLFEFIQAGLPILANDSPELRRFVHDLQLGLVMPMHTPHQMASAIDCLFSDSLMMSAYQKNLQRE